MNDFELINYVFIDIDNVYRNCDELNIIYKLNGRYLWVKNEIEIIKGYEKFSLRNLDKLLKMLKKNKVKFNKFEIQS